MVGVLQVTNEVAIVALFTTASVLGALWLARVCRNDLALLGLIVLVLVAYVLVYTGRPEWAAVTPLGPDQNLRYWGIGDQIATLLLAPLLMGAVIARQRFGWFGFAAFSLLGIFVMTDNRLGANGGGAIGLGLALALLGARLSRRGVVALVGAVAAAGVIVLAIVQHGLASPGPNHLRSAFGSGVGGFVDVAAHRVPLVYAPAVEDWTLTLPLAVLLLVSAALAFRVTRAAAARDLLLALAAGLVASLLINDATGFMLTAGIACASSVARFTPTGARVRVPVLAHARRARRGARHGQAAARLSSPGPLVPSARVPIYEYRCPNGHHFERFQSMTAPAPEKCDECGASPVELVLYPVAIHYKGSGFYTTDYGKGKAAKKDGDGGSSGGESKGGESGKTDSKPAEKKAAAGGDS